MNEFEGTSLGSQWIDDAGGTLGLRGDDGHIAFGDRSHIRSSEASRRL